MQACQEIGKTLSEREEKNVSSYEKKVAAGETLLTGRLRYQVSCRDVVNEVIRIWNGKSRRERAGLMYHALMSMYACGVYAGYSMRGRDDLNRKQKRHNVLKPETEGKRR